MHYVNNTRHEITISNLVSESLITTKPIDADTVVDEATLLELPLLENISTQMADLERPNLHIFKV